MQIKPNILWENIVKRFFAGDLAQASVNKKKEERHILYGNSVRGF